MSQLVIGLFFAGSKVWLMEKHITPQSLSLISFDNGLIQMKLLRE